MTEDQKKEIQEVRDWLEKNALLNNIDPAKIAQLMINTIENKK